MFEVLGAGFTIGRQSTNELQLPHESVSRSHCSLQQTKSGIVLSDLGSLCGTFVNGLPVQDRLLEHGDFLKVGDSLFLFLNHVEEPDDEGEEELFLDRNQEIQSTLELSLPQTNIDLRDRNARHLALLLELSTEIHAVSSVNALAQRLGELILDAIPAERVALLLATGDEFTLVHNASRDEAAETPGISRTLCRKVHSRQLAVWSNDVPSDPQLAGAPSLDGSGIRSVLGVPLVANDRSLGVLYADTSQLPAQFEEDHLKLLAAIAGIAAIALDHAQQREWLETENQRFRSLQLDHDIIGESPAMEKVLQKVARVAPSDLTVLVLGESGTGKELTAQALHRNSPRAEKPFVAINCATLSETLLESELFGHEKGAFTGAVGRKIGQFEMAHQGTLFLDEVGEIPLHLQARLLRALEAGEIQRVGGARPIPVDVRIVAATNRNLEQEIQAGNFRKDLFHRLNVFALTLPPLRARRQDIPLLAGHFIARFSQRSNRPLRRLSPEARAAITTYDWPGNVRELQNAMERAAVLAMDDLLRLEDLPEAILEATALKDRERPASNYHEAVAEAKRTILLQAIQQANGSYARAAESLGLNRTYLHRLASNLGLQNK